jgi:hypothetical protein
MDQFNQYWISSQQQVTFLARITCQIQVFFGSFAIAPWLDWNFNQLCFSTVC